MSCKSKLAGTHKDGKKYVSSIKLQIKINPDTDILKYDAIITWSAMAF